jgi:hypothetical protein
MLRVLEEFNGEAVDLEKIKPNVKPGLASHIMDKRGLECGWWAKDYSELLA